MGFDPMPADLVQLIQSEQFFPEVAVEHRFTATGPPVFQLPVLKPLLLEGVAEIAGIGIQFNPAWLLQGGKGLHRGSQFHAVVGRISFCSGKFLALLVFLGNQNRTPASRPGVRGAGTVGVDDNMLER